MSIDAYTKYVSGESEEEKKDDGIDSFNPSVDYVAEMQEAQSLETPEHVDTSWMDGGPGGARPAEKSAKRDERLRDPA